MNQLIERLAKLPRSQRFLLILVAYLLLVAVFYLALVNPTISDISEASKKRDELTVKRNEVKKRAENRPAFEAELEELAASLKQALKELPNDREIPGLLSEIDALARKSGLEVRKFQPLAEVQHEYYADVPVQIVMDGGYHEVAIFFDRVSKMSRIVSVEDIKLGDPKESGTEVNLTVEGKAVTFRFLTDEEIQKGKEPKKGKKGKKPEGGGGE
jgi:type IV pilus assembly protein PilO